MGEDKKENKSTRREFLKKSGYVTGGVVGGGILGGLLGSQFWQSEEATTTSTPTEKHDQALQYFTNVENFRVVEQATERIFPEDDNGPGAIGLGVAYYIDHQLAGKWGINAKEYRQGPFYEGEPNQGYQTSLKHHEIFDLGIEAIQKYSEEKFDEKFTALEGEQQDEVLVAFENDEAEMPVIKTSFFFEILRTATLEGAYADPLYGGNKDKQGWKMKEYPGVQMSYTEEQIDSEDFLKIEPASLHDTHN